MSVKIRTEEGAITMRGVDSLYADLNEACSPGSLLRRWEPLAKRTTLRVGGGAELYFEAADETDLRLALGLAGEHGVPWMVLGRGSNLLIRDGGIRGLVISLGREAFSMMVVQGERIAVGAGARLKHLAVEARRHGIAGLEFLEGIPGSVGGALRMNAGAMGSATFDRLESLRALDCNGHVVERARAELEVTYRHCPFFDTHVALSAVFLGEARSKEEIEIRMKSMNSKRWESQPSEPSAGCIFKNPAGMSAGRLIDEVGLKGTVIGGARVSEIHGNFIVNAGGSTAADVLKLIEVVRHRVFEARGILLETEVLIVGEEGSV